MKRVLELSDKDIGCEEKLDAKSQARTSARAIIKKGNKIAMQHISKYKYYKLPGGGVEEGETIQEALYREIREETGCTIKVICEIGEIIEHRSHANLIQTSHCYLAAVEKEGTPQLTKDEIEEGCEIVWCTIEEAIKLMKNEIDDYEVKFMTKRDTQFLKEAEKIINQTSRQSLKP